MNLMNYIYGMKPQRIISSSKPIRPLRHSLRRNTARTDGNFDVDGAKHGYVLVGTQKLPVRKPDSRRVPTPAETHPSTHTRSGSLAITVEPNHEIIEVLFREARDGKFDAFSRRLKGIIKQYSALEASSQDLETAALSAGASTDPLAAARQRGANYALTEWQRPENLTLQAAAGYASVSDNTINTRRQNQQIYALVAPNRSRGFRYPQWQFDVDLERLRIVIKAFFDVGQNNCWVLHNLLTRPTPELGDMRPCDYIADSSLDLKRLVQFIHRRFYNGDQGAA